MRWQCKCGNFHHLSSRSLRFIGPFATHAMPQNDHCGCTSLSSEALHPQGSSKVLSTLRQPVLFLPTYSFCKCPFWHLICSTRLHSLGMICSLTPLTLQHSAAPLHKQMSEHTSNKACDKTQMHPLPGFLSECTPWNSQQRVNCQSGQQSVAILSACAHMWHGI